MFNKDVLNIPNQLTLLRLICVPVFIASMIYLSKGRLGFVYLPLVIFAVAMITDALDGFLARLLKQKTELGTWLDPLADKLLLVSAFILLGTIKYPLGFKVPIWLLITVISRDVLIALGSLLIYMFRGTLKVRPSYLGKITTCFQMATVIISLIGFAYIKNYVWALTGFFTVCSGIDYIMKGSKSLDG